jgi:hypothetical protein
MATNEKSQNGDLKATESHGRGSVAEGELEILGYKPELQVSLSESSSFIFESVTDRGVN